MTRKLTDKSRKRSGTDALPEHDEQVLVVTYLRKRNLLVYAVPNAARRHMRQGAWLKAEGLSAGVPDLVIPMASKGFHGLYIEMKKTVGSVVQETQRYWQDQLQKQGYRAEICRGHAAAIKVIEEYFS